MCQYPATDLQDDSFRGLVRIDSICKQQITLTGPSSTSSVYAAIVDQDQAAQNVHPDLCSILSTLVKQCRQKQP